MKKVIVATNFSEEAENATIYAAQAAAALNLELVLFNLHNVSIHALNARTSSNSMNHGLALAKLELAEAAKKLESEYHIKVTPHIASGDITDELNRCFVTHEADMLVLGMPEKSVEQDLLGNTTTLVINKIKYPIMAIPKSVKFEGIKKFYLPVT
jgi:nucleotide-binding universal stress UspA family protein